MADHEIDTRKFKTITEGVFNTALLEGEASSVCGRIMDPDAPCLQGGGFLNKAHCGVCQFPSSDETTFYQRLNEYNGYVSKNEITPFIRKSKVTDRDDLEIGRIWFKGGIVRIRINLENLSRNQSL